MPFSPVTAINALVRINNVVYTAQEWTVTPTGEELDITNFEGAGFYEFLVGIKSCEIVVKAQWDSAASNFATPPTIIIGATLTNLRLYLAGLLGPFWSFPSARILTTPTDANVHQGINVSFTAKATGTFSYPA